MNFKKTLTALGVTAAALSISMSTTATANASGSDDAHRPGTAAIDYIQFWTGVNYSGTGSRVYTWETNYKTLYRGYAHNSVSNYTSTAFRGASSDGSRSYCFWGNNSWGYVGNPFTPQLGLTKAKAGC
ncbi:hypothetical protein ADL00_28725 [Streptomyces sp. AS58]|uniref:Lactococcin 972 family bacteriocin n=1 Tax=Streptomyces cadmiisoli TaxID=2184053 RepID=A0A2Z4J2Y5_9ACTN|nr:MULTISPECIES: hypothetical protein [Streptomyces]AWW39591.1 hypothetical protein DN051_25430 [Streptomyces cadmiisoli]KOV55859.1 hypothetical protein ADL00_28725 [Streptomyces sp. AS58]